MCIVNDLIVVNATIPYKGSLSNTKYRDTVTCCKIIVHVIESCRSGVFESLIIYSDHYGLVTDFGGYGHHADRWSSLIGVCVWQARFPECTFSLLHTTKSPFVEIIHNSMTTIMPLELEVHAPLSCASPHRHLVAA